MSPRGVKTKFEMEAEIDEIAKKIRENNSKLMQKLTNTNNLEPSIARIPNISNQNSVIDTVGKFGWETLGSVPVPYFFRNEEKYVSLRMVNEKILHLFHLFFTPEVLSCFKLETLQATQPEADLLNEINFEHCDRFFGLSKLTAQDEILLLKDFVEFFHFTKFCYSVLVLKTQKLDRCAFVHINNTTLVPVVYSNSKKYVPLFYFDCKSKFLEERSLKLKECDMAYMRFCCKLQKIRKTFYNDDTCKVVDLEDVIRMFPQGTSFTECWPESIFNSTVLNDFRLDPNKPQQLKEQTLTNHMTKTYQNPISGNSTNMRMTTVPVSSEPRHITAEDDY